MILQKIYPRHTTENRGFTLIELAIVLAVASLLFAGLWRLLSAGNTQLQDQATADQQKQLLNAVQAYLASSEGQNNVLAPHAASDTFVLPLPTSATDCTGTIPPMVAPATAPAPKKFCDFLPQGFTDTTMNPYGQTYSIRVRKNSGAAGSPATAYSFMILTNGTTAIPDTSGGRIASMIGNDGGFIYTAQVCGAPANQKACGAFGSWTADTQTDFGFATSASGSVASRSYIGVGALSSDPWLARIDIQGDGNAPGGTTADFNTLQTSTFLLANTSTLPLDQLSTTPTNFFLGNNTLYGASDANGFGGKITNLHYMTVGLNDLVTTGNPRNNDLSSSLIVNTPCQASAPGVWKADVNDNSCNYALSVNGDQQVSGLLVANRLFAGTFIYDTASDQRLKHDIVPIPHPLDDLGQIRGVSFKMNQNDEKKLGVIAQEVEKVYPQLIHDAGNGYKGVDYIGLIGPLIGAVNELKEQNAKLATEIQQQAEEIRQLKKASE